MDSTPLVGAAQYTDGAQSPAELWLYEGNVPFVYGDSKGVPTIGIGVNLTVSSNMAAFLNTISIDGVALFAQAASATDPYGPTSATQVVAAFETLLADPKYHLTPNPGQRFPISTSNDQERALGFALNSLVASYYPTGTLVVGGVTGASFSDYPDGLALTEQLIGQSTIAVAGYGNVYTYAQQLNDWLTDNTSLTGVTNPWNISVGANIPPTNTGQYEALLSLFFNGPTAIGKGLLTALQDGNVAQAWYQIRYETNPGESTGVAARRYGESQLFGLWQAGDTYSSAIQDYEMLNEDRQVIIGYEAKLGTDPDTGGDPTKLVTGTALSRGYGKIIQFNVQQSAHGQPAVAAPLNPILTLDAAFNPAAEAVATTINGWYSSLVPMVGVAFDPGHSATFNVRGTDILVAADATDISDGFAARFGASDNVTAPDSPNATHILIGPDSVVDPSSILPQATLTGGGGDDLLIADAGNEVLYGGSSGNDTLIGGQGLPTSISGASGNDTLYGGTGSDTFIFALPTTGTTTETIVPIAGSTPSGIVEMSYEGAAVPLGGSASDELIPVGVSNVWSASGGSSGIQYSYDAINQTLTISDSDPVSSGGMGGTSIIIDNFDLAEAESQTGFLGLHMVPQFLLTAGSNAGVDPPAPDFLEATSQSYTIATDAASSGAQTVTLTLAGAPPSDFEVQTNTGQDSLSPDGTFSVVIPAGETSASFSLENVGDVGTDSQIAISATLQNPDTGVTTPISSNTVNQTYIEASANPFVPSNLTDLYGSVVEADGSGGPLSVGDYSNTVSGTPATVSGGDNYIMVEDAPNGSIAGGAGNDTIFAYFGDSAPSGGVDVISGNGGQDYIVADDGLGSPGASNGPSSVRIYAGSEVDLATAIADANLPAASGVKGDLLTAATANSTIVGGTGNDLLVDDWDTSGIIVAGSGNDTILGGVELAEYTATDESLAGGTAVDQQWSTSSSNNQLTLGGNLIYSAWGAPEVTGVVSPPIPPAKYEGNLDSYGAPLGLGNDTIYGGAGNDLIVLSNGDNEVSLGIGSTTVLGGMGENTITGGDGDNSVIGGGGDDYVAVGSGNDSVVGNGGNNTIIGGSGGDTLVAGAAGANYATQETGDNYIQAGSGNTLIQGSGGNDTLLGGAGADTIEAGSGNEFIVAGTGNESVNGGSGSDTIDAGGSGTDTLLAGSGNATIAGGDGTDIIQGGSGSDVLYAGDGGTAGAATSVLASLSDSGAQATIYGGAGIDFLQGGAGTSVIYAGDGGTNAAPTTVLGTSGTDTLYGGSGTDFIQGGSGSDVLYAGDGGTAAAPDTVVGGSGTATLYGGGGQSILQDTTSGSDLLVSATADDTLIGTGNDTLVAGTGDDVLQSEGGTVTAEFGAGYGNDSIYTLGGNVNLAFQSGVELADITGGVGVDSAGNWYLDLAGDGSGVAVEGGLTGSLGAVTFSDTGGVSLQSLLTDVLGGDLVVAAGSSNLFVSVADNDTASGGLYNDTIASWGNNSTLRGGTNLYGDQIVSEGSGALIASGTGKDTIVSAGDNATITGGSFADHITVGGAGSLVTSSSGQDSITASGTDDTLIGGAGNSTFYVNNGSTVVEAGSGGGADSIIASVSFTAPTNINVLSLDGPSNLLAAGNSGADSLIGGAGQDTLVSGGGADTLIAGSGNTTFVVNSTSDVVRDSSTTTTNAIDAAVSYTLPTNVNSLIFTGTENLVGTANTSNDTITSNSGLDTLVGGAGSDTFVINNIADVIVPGTGTINIVLQSGTPYTLPTSVNSLTLTGSDNVSVQANSGNDSIGSNVGVDTLIGGGGNDTFTVNNAGDVVQDTSATALNVLISTVSYTLPDNVNTLRLVGSAAIVGTGNSASDTLSANSGADTLMAGAGAATMIGGAGNDVFVLNNSADVIQDTFTTTNSSVQSSVSYSLVAYVNSLFLTGSANLVGTANGGVDTLFSNSGIDTLVGGAGADTFVVSSAADVIQDSTGDAANVVLASVDYSLPNNVNAIILTGTANISGTGNTGNDSLVGGVGADSLIGTAGRDTLVAGSGATTLEGGTGADLFILNSTADWVTVSGSHGADTILSSVSYTLPVAVNTLMLSGSAALSGTAISGNNLLVGGSGADTLTAGLGSDTLVAGSAVNTLIGGSGADTFVVNIAADVLMSISGAAGNVLDSSVSYTLPAGISVLDLSGTAALMGVGNSVSDTIAANAGSDTLIAGSGAALLIGGIGVDTFIVNSSADTISEPDFGAKPSNDVIDASVSYTLPSGVDDLLLTGTTALIGTGNLSADSLVGNAGADTLVAGPGNDTLVAGTGIATLVGGVGGDTFVINATADVVDDSAGGAGNAIVSSVSYTLPDHVDALLLSGSGNLVGTANSDNDSIVGNSGADTLVAGAGNDTLGAGTGVDTFVAGSGPVTFIVNNVADVIQNASTGGSYSVLASAGYSLPTDVNALTLTGLDNIEGIANAGNDTLTAGAGDDTLVAGAAADTLIGGAGNTTFVVNSSSDVVQDASTTTNNAVLSSVTYVAPTNVNTLILTGTENLEATANLGNDTLGDNGAIDTLVGGAGNETFLVSNSADVVNDTATTSSNFLVSSASFSLVSNVNTLTLTGTLGLVGQANSGADTLVSNAGQDTLIGGSEGDTFVINNANDVVVDSTGGVSNIIDASVDYSLPTDVNTLLFTGTANLQGAGNSAADLLTANAGNDTLIAGGGATTLVSGSGASVFVVDNSSDVVLESASGTGSSVQSSVSYSLPSNISTLILTGTGNLSASANSAGDTLISNSGVDTLVGGSGADVFVINNSADVILGASSNDTIESSVSFTLPAGVSHLILQGAGALVGTGGATGATLTANGGADTLVGGAGVVTMFGGAGNDTFVVNKTGDVVEDANYLTSNTVVASVNYTLPANVDTLILSGASALTAVGNNDWDNVIYADSAGSHITGTAENNTLYGGTGSDNLYGGSGTDLIVTGTGYDAVYAGSGDETVNAALGQNTVTGGTGDNVIYGGADTQEIFGGGGDNLIYAGSGGTSGAPTIIYGNLYAPSSGTQSTIYAGSGVDKVSGGADSDLIYGGTGTSTLYAGTGYDSIYGTSGSMVVDTEGGHDLLSAGAGSGAETISGFNSDTLAAGTGAALLEFGSGTGASGTYEINAGFGQVTIGSGTGGVDNIAFGPGLSPADFTVSLAQTATTGSYYNQRSLVLTDGTSALNLVAGFVPGVVGTITFADSGPISLTQLVQESSGLGTTEATQLELNTDSDASLVDTVSIAGMIAFGDNDTITAGPSGDEPVFAYGNDDVITTDNVWAGGSGTTVNVPAGDSGGVTLAGGNDTVNVLSGGGSTVTVYQSSDLVNVNSGATTTDVFSLVSYTLPVGAAVLTLGANGLVATSNASGGELFTRDSADTLIGSSGADYLDAAGSNDVLVGGSGAETYVLGNSSDSIQLGTGDASVNAILAGFSYTLPTGVNSLTLTNNSDLGLANSANDVLTSWAEYDTVVAGVGNDTLASNYYSGYVNTLVGGTGNDTFEIDNTADVVIDSAATASNTLIASVNYTLPTNVNTLVLTQFGTDGTGNSANDSMVANAASETLMAGSGSDTLSAAGTATDAVLVAGSGIDVLEDQGGGATFVLNAGFSTVQIHPATGDIIQFGAGVTLSALTFTAVPDTGGAPPSLVISGTGESATVQGGVLPGVISQVQFSGDSNYSIAQLLVPGADQTVAGANGNLILSSANDDSINGGAGSDTVIAWGSTDTLQAGSGGTLVYAAGSADIAAGGAGIDTLVADGVNDTLVGGTGNESLVVNDSSAIVNVSAGVGHDTVYSSVGYSVPANVTVFDLTGTAAIGVLANSGSDLITGNSGADSFRDGGGLDTFVGGAGNNTFFVNDSTDTVQVSSSAGTNLVVSAVSYTLPSNVNYLTLTGSANLTATGNAGNDSIAGNAGNDVLIAGSGNDTLKAFYSASQAFGVTTLIGGSGNDYLFVGYAYGDSIVSGSGIDTLVAGQTDVLVVNNSADVLELTYGSLVAPIDTIQSSVSYTLAGGTANNNEEEGANADLTWNLIGSSGIVANAGMNDGYFTISGNAGADTLIGGTGSNDFIAGSGVDTLLAVAGSTNSFTVTNSADVVVDTSGSADVIYAQASYSLPASVSTLYVQSAGVVGTGNSGSDYIEADGGSDTLVAGSGVDTLRSITGANTLVGGAGADLFDMRAADTVVLNLGFGASQATVVGGTGTPTVRFGSGIAGGSLTVSAVLDSSSQAALAIADGPSSVTLDGALSGQAYQFNLNGAGTLTLAQFLSQVNISTSSVVGSSGNVILEGAPSVSLTGGSGNDTIYAAGTSDTITGGTGAQVLDVLGSADSIIGGSASDTLMGLGSNDSLVAGSAVDTLVGGTGATVAFVINSSSDVIQLQSSPGLDSVVASASFSLPTNINSLTLTGTSALKGTANSGNDLLVANLGADTLIGGSGADTLVSGLTGADSLVGGSGNDVFFVSSTADHVKDTSAASSNVIESSVGYTLPTDVNTLILLGTAALSGKGNAAADSMTANSGNDTLTAGTGVATLVGGAGNDTFVVDNTGDVVRDTFTATSNTLSSSVTYSLPGNINTLIFTGTAALKGTANSGNDTLTANTGADTLVGGSGNDTFVISKTTDVLSDTFTTTSNTLTSSVAYSLPTNINTLVLTGTAALKGTANSSNDSLSANSGKDTLVAGSGTDTLVAGITGADSLVGGSGNDTFVVNNTSDVITVTATGTADSILSTVNYVLPGNVEYLTLTGTAALGGTGNSLTDLIIGNTGNDTLTGGAGIAVLEGGRTAGSDLLRASSNQAALIAGAGSSTLIGGAFKDFYAAGKVSDSITVGATANVIAINSGDGATTLQPTTSSTDVLSLGAGIDTEALTFSKSGNNLILSDGVSGDSITLTNWYVGSSDQNVTTLQVIEAASASYNSGGTDGLRNQPLEDFNFATLVSAFNTAGDPANWALSNDMASAQLSSSSTQAYGGDLAYYFGLNGNLTGLQLSAAQSALTNGSFATAQQTLDSWSSISGGGGVQLLAIKAPAAPTNAEMPETIGASATSASSSSTPATEGLAATIARTSATTVQRTADPGLHMRGMQLEAIHGLRNLVTPTVLSWGTVEHPTVDTGAAGATEEFGHGEERWVQLQTGTSLLSHRPVIERGPLNVRRSA